VEASSLRSVVADEDHRHRRAARRDGCRHGSAAEGTDDWCQPIIAVQDPHVVADAVTRWRRAIDVHVREGQCDAIVWNRDSAAVNVH